MWPSFVVAYHPLVSRRYAVGASKVLLQYLQRGYPEYCVDAIVKGVHSVAKMRSGSAVGFRGSSSGGEESAVGIASLRLLVMGNYCAEILRTAGHPDHAKKILNKIEILTSIYTAPFSHKTLFRVWTLCNMAILHADKRQPEAAYTFIDTAAACNVAAREEHQPAAQILVATVRGALLCRSAQFDRACADLVYARDSLARLQAIGLSSSLGPCPNAAAHTLSVALLYNGALASMCMPEAHIQDAREWAEAAWSEVRNCGSDSQAAVEEDLRKRCLRLRDALAQRGSAAGSTDLFHDYLNAVRAASMTPEDAWRVQVPPARSGRNRGSRPPSALAHAHAHHHACNDAAAERHGNESAPHLPASDAAGSDPRSMRGPHPHHSSHGDLACEE